MSGDRLADMRRAYDPGELDESALAGGWLALFERWLGDAVEAGLAEPNAMVLATAGSDGVPSARTVLLKGLDADGFVLFTNRHSRKGAEIAADARAALLFPWHAMQRQVEVAGRVEPISEDESDAYFASRPRGSQLSAAASPQSSVIAGRAVLERAQEELAARFPDGTPVPRPAHWGGLRVVPVRVEFWQGRPDRLHDRLRCRQSDDGGWVVERLAP